jgi:hypothetical protein
MAGFGAPLSGWFCAPHDTKSPPTDETQPSFYLLGIVQGHFTLNADAVVDTSDETGQDKTAINTGLAIVTPLAKLIDILDDAALVKRRADAFHAWRARDAGVPD